MSGSFRGSRHKGVRLAGKSRGYRGLESVKRKGGMPRVGMPPVYAFSFSILQISEGTRRERHGRNRFAENLRSRPDHTGNGGVLGSNILPAQNSDLAGD